MHCSSYTTYLIALRRAEHFLLCAALIDSAGQKPDSSPPLCKHTQDMSDIGKEQARKQVPPVTGTAMKSSSEKPLEGAERRDTSGVTTFRLSCSMMGIATWLPFSGCAESTAQVQSFGHGVLAPYILVLVYSCA